MKRNALKHAQSLLLTTLLAERKKTGIDLAQSGAEKREPSAADPAKAIPTPEN
jgi:hypothetical protein